MHLTHTVHAQCWAMGWGTLGELWGFFGANMTGVATYIRWYAYTTPATCSLRKGPALLRLFNAEQSMNTVANTFI